MDENINGNSNSGERGIDLQPQDYSMPATSQVRHIDAYPPAQSSHQPRRTRRYRGPSMSQFLPYYAPLQPPNISSSLMIIDIIEIPVEEIIAPRQIEHHSQGLPNSHVDRNYRSVPQPSPVANNPVEEMLPPQQIRHDAQGLPNSQSGSNYRSVPQPFAVVNNPVEEILPPRQITHHPQDLSNYQIGRNYRSVPQASPVVNNPIEEMLPPQQQIRHPQGLPNSQSGSNYRSVPQSFAVVNNPVEEILPPRQIRRHPHDLPNPQIGRNHRSVRQPSPVVNNPVEEEPIPVSQRRYRPGRRRERGSRRSHAWSYTHIPIPRLHTNSYMAVSYSVQGAFIPPLQIGQRRQYPSNSQIGHYRPMPLQPSVVNNPIERVFMPPPQIDNHHEAPSTSRRRQNYGPMPRQPPVDVNSIEIQDDGLTDSQLEQIPIMIFDSRSKGETSCVICLEEFIEAELLKVLPCTHRYHVACIYTWLKSRPVCPLCRRYIN